VKLEIRESRKGLVQSMGILIAILSFLFVMTTFSGYVAAPSKELPGGYEIEYNLISNTDHCLVDCSLKFNFSLNKDYTITDVSKFKSKFVKATGALDLRDWGFRIRQNETYEVDVPEYGACNEYVCYNSSNSTCAGLGYDDWNGTHCEYGYTCQTGSHTEERWHWTWNDFNPIGKTIVGGKWYTIELWGKKRPKLGGNSIDAIPVILDYELPYKWWLDNWANYRNITITASQDTTHTNDFHQVNVSNLTLATDNCTKELRLLDGDDANEMDFLIIDDSGQSLGDGNEWCVVGFNATVTKATDKNVSAYYNYASASAPSYMDEELAFPTIAQEDDGYVSGRFKWHDGEGYSRTAGSAGHTNVTVAEEGGRWHSKFSVGDNQYEYWESATPKSTNITYIIRTNTSDADDADHTNDYVFRYTTGSYNSLIEFHNDTIYTEGSNWTIDMTTMYTYKIIYENNNRNLSMWVFNSSNQWYSVLSVTNAGGAGDETFLIGDGQQAATDSPHTDYIDFFGYNTNGAYPPLRYTLGKQQTNPISITFNVTSGEDGYGIDDEINITCNYSSFNQLDDTTNPYGPYVFPNSSWSCKFFDPLNGWFNETVVFISDRDKTINITMSKTGRLTKEEHEMLEAIYECIINGECDLYNMLQNVTETTSKIWNQYKRTDQSVVIDETITNSVVNNTHNLTIVYNVSVPKKEGYGVVEGLQGYDDFLPVRLSFWFLNYTNETCYNQGTQPTGVNSPYCQPLTITTVGEIEKTINFTVDLKPTLEVGNYTIIRSIEIDPENIWIDYGQEIIGGVEVLSLEEPLISLKYEEPIKEESDSIDEFVKEGAETTTTTTIMVTTTSIIEDSVMVESTRDKKSPTGLFGLFTITNMSLGISLITLFLVGYIILTRKR
jgi:hypothetical protein